MKTTFILSIYLFSFLFSYSQAQIPNGDLETWTDTYNAEGWNSINFGFPLEIHTAVQSDDAYEGNYAAELTTQSTVLGMIPGLITFGEIDIENFTITGGIPFNDRPNGISFWFKYSPVQSDTMFFAAILTKWNTINEETDTIGVTAYFAGETYNEYAYLAIPFIYASEEIPDTMNVLFTSSGFSGNDGSSLLIDNVMIEYGTLISPTICFPAQNISSTGFDANWLGIPNAVSYRIDVSENNDFSGYYSGIEDTDTGTDTFYTADVTPGIYFYRTRVFYEPEISINSNTIAVPCPTICNDASNITGSSFTANWETANNATNYFIDVSESSNFETYVNGYEDLSVGNQINYNVTGLNGETAYYYRVRAEYGTYLSDDSNMISVTTGVADILSVEQLFSILTDRNLIYINAETFIIGKIDVYDINGKFIDSKEMNNNRTTFNISTPGIYIIKIQTTDKVYSKKINIVF